MSTLAEVRLWGRTIGAVSLDDRQPYAAFEYARDFAQSGIELSPITMPLSREVFRFPELSLRSFCGLPGLLADSLPDRFGTAVIDAWLAAQGRSPDSFNAVERLCFIGERGMGALEFQPMHAWNRTAPSKPLQVDRLIQLASDVLSQQDRLRTSFEDRGDALRDLLHVGTSAGGVRAKAIVAWNRETNELHCGSSIEPGFESWILKLDGLNGDGALEYAYARMAHSAGIEMQPCELMEEGGRRHFMTRRFDRQENGRKLHMQSLGALAHYDYNRPGDHAYEQVFYLMRTLELGMTATEQFFRRMVFNVLARNQDDHVKNIAFLMDRQGRWSLAPAFDLNYAYNPSDEWTAQHQMTINGKQHDFTLDDLRECAKAASMKRGRAETILDEVDAVIADWTRFAQQAGVDEITEHRISKGLRRAKDLR